MAKAPCAWVWMRGQKAPIILQGPHAVNTYLPTIHTACGMQPCTLACSSYTMHTPAQAKWLQRHSTCVMHAATHAPRQPLQTLQPKRCIPGDLCFLNLVTPFAQCVLLEFDRSIWREVYPTNATAWFAKHLLLSEGSVVRCPGLPGLCRLHNVAWLKSRLVGVGVLLELPGPGQLLRLIQQQFRSWLAHNTTVGVVP